MRQAITTRYLGPTNFRGSRIKATADAGSVTVSYDHALSTVENHAAAARALAKKFDWGGEWVGGGLPEGTGYVYVDVTGATFKGDAFKVGGEDRAVVGACTRLANSPKGAGR